MTETKKAAPSQSSLNQTSRSNNITTIQPGKLESMFARFATGQRLHRFQAEHLGDHCLHTTVSFLQSKYVIKFSRQWVKVRNRFGTETRVMMYWLDGENLAKAQLALGWEVAA